QLALGHVRGDNVPCLLILSSGVSIMRGIITVLAIVLAVPLGRGEEKGHAHQYNRADLPKAIKVKAGDTVVVIEAIKPADVEAVTAQSNNKDVKVKSIPGIQNLRIEITSREKGQAKVSWKIEQADGRIAGARDVEIEFQ